MLKANVPWKSDFILSVNLSCLPFVFYKPVNIALLPTSLQVQQQQQQQQQKIKKKKKERDI